MSEESDVPRETVPGMPLMVSFNEDNIERALINAHGDLYMAADLMGHVTVRRLDFAIRRSERLQRAFLAIEQIKGNAEYARITTEQLEAEVTRRITVYRADGLDALHDLATMDVGKNSAMAQVKLTAAMRLAGPTGGGMGDGDGNVAETLRALNQLYEQTAPKIKVTRTQIEISPGPGAMVQAHQILDSPPQPG